MITRRRADKAASLAPTIAAILNREPFPLAHYSQDVPSELQRIVSKALHKDRDKRYQTAKDLLIDLQGLRQSIEFQLLLQE